MNTLRALLLTFVLLISAALPALAQDADLTCAQAIAAVIAARDAADNAQATATAADDAAAAAEDADAALEEAEAAVAAAQAKVVLEASRDTDGDELVDAEAEVADLLDVELVIGDGDPLNDPGDVAALAALEAAEEALRAAQEAAAGDAEALRQAADDAAQAAADADAALVLAIEAQRKACGAECDCDCEDCQPAPAPTPRPEPTPSPRPVVQVPVIVNVPDNAPRGGIATGAGGAADLIVIADLDLDDDVLILDGDFYDDDLLDLLILLGVDLDLEVDTDIDAEI